MSNYTRKQNYVQLILFKAYTLTCFFNLLLLEDALFVGTKLPCKRGSMRVSLFWLCGVKMLILLNFLHYSALSISATGGGLSIKHALAWVIETASTHCLDSIFLVMKYFLKINQHAKEIVIVTTLLVVSPNSILVLLCGSTLMLCQAWADAWEEEQRRKGASGKEAGIARSKGR